MKYWQAIGLYLLAWAMTLLLPFGRNGMPEWVVDVWLSWWMVYVMCQWTIYCNRPKGHN